MEKNITKRKTTPKKRTKVPGSGRKKGTPNKTTAEMKKWITLFVSKGMKQMDEVINNMSDEEKIELYKELLPKLIPYVLPKQNTNKISLDEETQSLLNMKESMQKINELF